MRVTGRASAAIARSTARDGKSRSVRNATWVFLVNLPLPVLLLNLPGWVLSNLALVLLLPLCGCPGTAWAFVRGRLRGLTELPAIAAERTRLSGAEPRPLRRSWEAIG